MANAFDDLDAPAAPNAFDELDNTHPAAGPSGNTLTDTGRFAGTVGANTLAGLLSMPRSAAQGVDWLGNKVGVNIGADPWLGSFHDPTDANKPAFPSYTEARDMAFATEGGGYFGGKPATEYVPETYWGRRGMDAATAATLGVLSGGAGAALPNALGGATSGAAAEAFPEHPFIAGMAGFIPGSALGGGIASGGQRLARSLGNGATSEPYGAFERLGLPTDLSGTVTDNKTLQALEKGAGPSLTGNREKLLTAWQNKLDDVTQKVGSATTPEELGTTLQNSANKWVSDWKDQTNNLWADFNSKMPANTPVETANYKAALTKLQNNFSGAPASGSALQSGTIKNLSDALESDLKGGTTLPFQSVAAMRTAIGDRLSNPQLVGDASQGALKTLYGGLTRDLAKGADNVSPEAGEALRAATEATKTGHDLMERHLNPILTATTPEDAARFALAQAQRGSTRLSALTDAMPETKGEIASYTLQNLAGNTNSPTAFANGLNGRRPALSREAQNLLFPDVAKQDIADLATTADKLRGVEKDMQPGAHPSNPHTVPRFFGAVEGARTGHEVFGVPGAIAGAGIGYALPGMSPARLGGLPLGSTTSSVFAREPWIPSTKAPFARSIFSSTLGGDIPTITVTPNGSSNSQ